MDLIEKTPPVPLRDRPVGANTPLDHQILAVLERQGTAWRPGEIATKLDENPQRVSARLRKLVARGLVIKTAAPGAPARGPGAFLYSAVNAASEMVNEYLSSSAPYWEPPPAPVPAQPAGPN